LLLMEANGGFGVALSPSPKTAGQSQKGMKTNFCRQD
jgi:hypothetical protein